MSDNPLDYTFDMDADRASRLFNRMDEIEDIVDDDAEYESDEPYEYDDDVEDDD